VGGVEEVVGAVTVSVAVDTETYVSVETEVYTEVNTSVKVTVLSEHVGTGAAVERHAQPLRIRDSIFAPLQAVAHVGRSDEVGVAVYVVQKSPAEAIIALYEKSEEVSQKTKKLRCTRQLS
jgi:hypothetical protein